MIWLNHGLSCFLLQNSSWIQQLAATGKSPHEIVFGKPPIDPYSTILASQVPQHAPGVQTFAEARQQLRAQVKEAIEKAKGKYTI